MNNLKEAKNFANSLPYSVDLSKLDGTETTGYEVAEKVLSLPDLVDWFEKDSTKHNLLVLRYNPSHYDEFAEEANKKLKELKYRLNE